MRSDLAWMYLLGIATATALLSLPGLAMIATALGLLIWSRWWRAWLRAHQWYAEGNFALNRGDRARAEKCYAEAERVAAGIPWHRASARGTLAGE